MITYTLNVDSGQEELDEYNLNAATDRGARAEAKKIIKENNIDITACILTFYRSSDSCTGQMDI